MKSTEIHVRGYDCNFIVTLEKDYFISLEQAIAWVKSEIIDTAIVILVIQKWPEGDLEIFNPNTNLKPNYESSTYEPLITNNSNNHSFIQPNPQTT